MRLPTATDAMLAAYLVLSAFMIALALALSPVHMLTVSGLLVSAVCVLAASLAAWWLRGRPALPLEGVARKGRATLQDPALVVLACGLALALVYAAALAVATPANNYDSLWYHLARPAFWKQQHAVDYIAGANDARLDIFPPGAEIVSAWAMVLEGSERFASLFQLVAVLAAVVAVAGISRRLGLTVRQATFGALLFASLPVVALQASTPLNDVVLCSYVVTAVYFVLSRARPALLLGALALALAVMTKGTALLAVPLVAVAAAVVRPRADWLRIAALGAGGLLLGGVWYIVNLQKTGDLLPPFVEHSDPPERKGAVAKIVGQLTRLLVDAADPAGAIGRDRLVYVVVAGILVLAGVALGVRGQPRRGALVFVVAGALALVPLAVSSLHDGLLRAHQRLWLELDEPAIAFMAFDWDQTLPSPFFSWYGPMGLLVFLAAIPIVVRAIRRGRLGRNTIAFLVAPVWYLVALVLALDYNIGHGRYLMPAVALSAATWGLIADVRPIAWFAATASVATLLVCFVHYWEKPSGIALLGGDSRASVWRATRSTILGAAHVPGPFGVIDELAEPGDVVALRLRQDDVSYPYFGAGLDRRVVFVRPGGQGLRGDEDWLVAAPGLSASLCTAGWSDIPTEQPGWRVYRRVGACPGERR
jgi:hypothetical protein